MRKTHTSGEPHIPRTYNNDISHEATLEAAPSFNLFLVPREPRPLRHHERQLNRRQRMALILERDGYECIWCRTPIEVGLNRATTEHVVPRIKGGPSWIENEVAACRHCNGTRGHHSPSAWLDECERLGLQPNREAIRRTLLALQHAILERGGQRRARPYVESQLRRV